MFNSFWIITACFLVAVNASFLGSFLILRKQAMIGDAISHSVLPGLAIAFMLTNSTHPLILFIGATLASLLATLLISFFEHQLEIAPDVATGIVFTTFFALGIALISLYTEKADLDQQCVLYGHPILIPFDLGYYGVPKSIYLLAILLLANSLFITLCYQSLLLTSFDPHFAEVIDASPRRWHYILMLCTALTTVVSFKIVGGVLVVAFLVIPAATAYLLTGKLKRMLLYTIIINMAIASLGYYLGVQLNGSIAGAMVTVSGLFFLLAWLAHIKKISPF